MPVKLGKQVARTATPLKIEDMARLLADAYHVVYPDDEPTRDELAWLLALARHENASGAAIVQHNWGNRAALSGENFWVPQWADMTVPASQLSDRVSALRKRYLAGEAVPGAFAAYPDHETGVRKFLELFRTMTNARILEAARANDAGEFHRAISLPHPTTGMAYCPDCTSGDVRAQYARLKEDSVRFFEKYPKAPAGEVSPSFSSAQLGQSHGGGRARSMPILRKGDSGHAVRFLQVVMGVHADSYFGPHLDAVVRGFQRRVGIEVDGIVGPETWRSLCVELGDRIVR